MPPIARLFLPPSGLSGCVMAGIYRDTRGVALAAEDRLNHFPATPMVSVTLVSHGILYLIPTAQDWRAARDSAPMPSCFVMGPRQTPTSSWSPGPVEAFTLGFFPDAWRHLGGDSTSTRVPDGLKQALMPLQQPCHGNADAQARWDAFCTGFQPQWNACRPANWHRATGIADWIRSLSTRAALSGSGRSLRSIERRTKRFSGHTRRSLAFFSAFERLHLIVRENSDMPLAEIAQAAGYADQSHMGRTVRRATGFSPARLNHAIQNEEPFWCYRLLGERF